MSGMGRTQVLSVHRFRRVARREERRRQALLAGAPGRGLVGLPAWATGVRVEKAGPFQWTVVATEKPGH